MLVRNTITILLALLPFMTMAGSSAVSPYDLQAPFGYCNMSSRTDASKTYTLTGGGAWTYPLPEGTDAAVITSNGSDMRTAISDAIKRHKVVVLDGSNGPILVSTTINMTALEDRTIMGVNNATLVTQWQVTDEIKKMLDDAGVPQMNSSDAPLGGTLPNGIAVREEAEYNTRLLMLQKYGNEDYRRSGFFTIQGCNNIIVRNIRFLGPGSIDVSGDDPIALYHSYNVWIDHCDFIDGMDGNLDLTSACDFCTVSWCTFSYTTKSYAHRLTNLIGGSVEEPEGTLNTTLAYNKWGTLCQNRMPMARMGIIHELNNLFDCPGASLCVNCNYHSSFLIEGNYFATGVKRIFRDYDSEAYIWAPTNYTVESFTPPVDKGTVSVPYTYEVIPATTIRNEIMEHAGATLYRDVTATPTEEEPFTPTDITISGNSYMVMGDTPKPYDGQRIICKDITMTYGNDGSWSEPRYTTPVPEGYKCLVAGEVNPVDNNGQAYSTSKKNTPTKGTYYVFTPTADGTLTAAFTVFTNKELYITEDGIALSLNINGTLYPVGSILNPNERAAASVTIPVKAGRTYHAFCKYSKVMFCGFSFSPATTAIVPVAPLSGNAPTLLYRPDGIRVTPNYRGVVKRGRN